MRIPPATFLLDLLHAHATPEDRVAAQRLFKGIAASLLVHLVLMLGLAPARIVPSFIPSPIEVRLTDAALESPVAEIVTQEPSDHAAISDSATISEPAEPPAPRSQAAPNSPVPLAVPFDRYYTARELDQRAEQMNDVSLVYPKIAYEMRRKGTVVLRLYINERGGLDQVSVESAVPPGVFEEAALTAAQALKFAPAMKNGMPVKSLKVIEVRFDPYESINVP